MQRWVLRLLGGLLVALGVSWVVAVPGWVSTPPGAGFRDGTSVGSWTGILTATFVLWPQFARQLAVATSAASGWPLGLGSSTRDKRQSIFGSVVVGAALALAVSNGGNLLALLLLIAIELVLFGVGVWLRSTRRLPRRMPPLWVQGLCHGPWWTVLALLLMKIWQDAIYDLGRAAVVIVVSSVLFGLLGFAAAFVSDAWLETEPDERARETKSPVAESRT